MTHPTSEQIATTMKYWDDLPMCEQRVALRWAHSWIKKRFQVTPDKYQAACKLIANPTDPELAKNVNTLAGYQPGEIERNIKKKGLEILNP